MASKRQRKRKYKARRMASSKTIDRDLSGLSAGSYAREGRFVHKPSHTNPDDHGDVREEFPLPKSEVVTRRVENRERLLEVMRLVGPPDLLAGAWFTHLRFDPDTYLESQQEPWFAYVEYLALQSLSVGLNVVSTVDPRERLLMMHKALGLTRSLFSDTVWLLVSDAREGHSEGEHEGLAHYQFKERIESLVVRGTGYTEHIGQVIRGCFSPVDKDCRRIFGFTGAEAVLLHRGVVDLMDTRAAMRQDEARGRYRRLLAELKRGRRTGSSEHSPEWLRGLPPNEAKQQVAAEMMEEVLADARRIAVFSTSELAAQVGVNHETAKAFLEAFSCDPASFSEEHHPFPVGAHPLTTNPVLRVEEGYLVPVPQMMPEKIRPRMEDLLRSDSVAWERYARVRANFLETEAVRLLADAVPGTKSWTGLTWASDHDNSDLDGLIDGGDIALRIQCKAGRITAPVRRGAPARTTEELGELIGDAARQHARLATALESYDAEHLGFSPAHAAALSRPLQIEVIVTLDEIVTWATQANQLTSIDILPPDRVTPWVLSLTDLMVVVDLLRGASLVDYIIRRQRLERDGRIQTHDELDWVGNYIEEGLFFDNHFEGEDAVGHVFLTTHTESIDSWYSAREGSRTVSTPKPAQPIPPGLERLVHRLERERPKHWLIACLALLSGNSKSRQALSDGLERLGDRLRANGSSSIGGILDRFGVTVCADHRYDPAVVRRMARRYASAKVTETGLANWIVVGEGPDQKLFVVISSEHGIESLASCFIDPPAQAPA